MDRRRPDMRPLVTVGEVGLPDPSKYEATTSTVVDSARNVQGIMVGAVIRDSIAKVVCEWRYLDAKTWSEILMLFEETAGGHFINKVTFLNQNTNKWETRQLYVSDRTSSGFKRNDNGDMEGYTSCRIALIEV